MLFSLLIGSFTLILMVVCFIKNKAPFLFMLAAFSFFYLHIRGWMLYLGIYENFAYLNKKVSISVIEHSYLPYLMLSIMMLLLFIGYSIGFKLSWTHSIKDRRINNLDIIIGVIVCFGLYFIYPTSLLIYAIFLLSLSLFQKQKRTVIFAIGSVLAFIVFAFITDDRRDYLALILLPVYWLIYKEKITSYKYIIITPLLLLLLVVISIGLRSGQASFEVILTGFDVFLRIIEIETDFSIVYDDLLYFFHEFFQGNVEILYGLTLLKPLLYFIPRSILPDKPDSLSILYSETFNPEFASIGGSEPITIIGDFFWNTGYFSFILTILFGFLLGSLDKIYRENKNNNYLVSVFCLMFCFLFGLLRGPFDTFAITYLFIIFFSFILHAKRFVISK